MKNLTILIFAALASTATAAEFSYTCSSDKGCREEEGPAFDIGRGARILLPSGWRFLSYPTAPIPIMAGLREVRATKGDTVIAISPIPNVNHLAFSESQLCEIVASPWRQDEAFKQSKERAVTPVPSSHDDIVSCHVSFSAANEGEKPFLALKRRFASVANFAISYKRSITFSVSIASERLPDEDYFVAVKAIQQIE